MASLYDQLCYYSLTSPDPFLEEILSYLPTGFHSLFLDYVVYEHYLDDESVLSFDSSFFAFYSDDSTYFSEKILYVSYFLCNSKLLPPRRAQDIDIKKGCQPTTTDNPDESPKASQLQEAPRARKWLQLLAPFLNSPHGEQPEPLPTIKAGQ